MASTPAMTSAAASEPQGPHVYYNRDIDKIRDLEYPMLQGEIGLCTFSSVHV